MADGPMTMEVVSPERLVFSETVESVVIPGVEGHLGILKNHAPMFAALGIGPIRYVSEGRDELLAVAGGFCEVADNRIVILSDSAERPQEIDVERAEEARKRARRRLREARKIGHDIDVARARAALARAENRLDVVEKSQHGA